VDKTQQARERLVKIMAANGVNDSISLDVGVQTGLLLDKLKPTVNDFIAKSNPTVGALMTKQGKDLLN
jgi:formate-dependent nitrite reductase cytochrome c552 subunit